MNSENRLCSRTSPGRLLVFAIGMLVSLGGTAASQGGEGPPASRPAPEPARTLAGHTDAVRSVAFSPDGKTLASGAFDGTTRLWDLPQAKERAKLEFQPRAAWDRVTSVLFTPDGKLLATGSTDGRVRFWDPVSGKELRSMEGQKGWCHCVAFSPDGKWVASGGSGTTVKLWEVDSGKAVHDGFVGRAASIRGIAFGADGTSIVTGGEDYGATIFRVNPPQELATLHLWVQVLSVASTRSDRALAFGLEYAGSIVLFSRDADGHLQRYILGGHDRGTNALAFSPDDKTLASVGNDGRLKLWDVDAHCLLVEATADPSAAFGVAYSADGGQLASAGADHKVRIWNVGQLKSVPQEPPRFPKIVEPLRRLRISHAEELRSVGELKRLGASFVAKGARPSWSPDAARIVYVSIPDSELSVLDLRTGKTRLLGETGRDPAWSPKPGRWIAYASGRQTAQFMGSRASDTPFIDPPQGDEEIRLIDSAGGPPKRIADGYAPAWSADAKTVYFISGKDQKVKSVEVKADGSPGAVKDLFGVSTRSLVAAISPDGKRVAYLGDGRLVVAGPDGEKSVPTWPTRHLRDWLLGWSPDGRLLGGSNVWGLGGLLFLDQATGRAIRLGTGELVAPAWSPDGSLIAFDDHLVDGSEIWVIDARKLASLRSAQPPYCPKGPAARFDIAAPFQPKEKLTVVDVQPKANQPMDVPTFDMPANDMAQVPQGEQTLAGVKFKIGPGSLQLGSGLLPDAPERIEGIAVNRRFTRMYVVHGTQFSGPTNKVADGTTIGWYRVVYEDRTEQSIAIVAGEDVRDWFAGDSGRPARGALAWEGSNQFGSWLHFPVRLFAGGWKNPHPEKKVARIDYLAAGTQAAPFCLAITIEEPASK